MKVWGLLICTLLVGTECFSFCKSGNKIKHPHLNKHRMYTRQRFENGFFPVPKEKRFNREQYEKPSPTERMSEEQNYDPHEMSLPDFHDDHYADVFGYVYTHNGDLVEASKPGRKDNAAAAYASREDVEACREDEEDDAEDELLDDEDDDDHVDDLDDVYIHEDIHDDFDYYHTVKGGGVEVGGGSYKAEVNSEEDDQNCCSCECPRRHQHKPRCKKGHKDQDGNY